MYLFVIGMVVGAVLVAFGLLLSKDIFISAIVDIEAIKSSVEKMIVSEFNRQNEVNRHILEVLPHLVEDLLKELGIETITSTDEIDNDKVLKREEI